MYRWGRNIYLIFFFKLATVAATATAIATQQATETATTIITTVLSPSSLLALKVVAVVVVAHPSNQNKRFVLDLSRV